MRTMNRPYALAALLAAMPCAWAVNKCTTPDGKVLYQAAPCEGGKRAKVAVAKVNAKADEAERASVA